MNSKRFMMTCSVQKTLSFELKMGVIEDELEDLKKRCEKIIPESTLVTCVSSQIRVEIKKSEKEDNCDNRGINCDKYCGKE